MTDGRLIRYTYDAAGTKLTKEVVDGKTTRTDYIGDVIYEDYQRQFIHHPEGRFLFASPAGGAAGGTEPTTQYFLKDHLGNNRLTIGEPQTYTYTATDSYFDTNHYNSSGGYTHTTLPYGGKNVNRSPMSNTDYQTRRTRASIYYMNMQVKKILR
jgi:YD repeat-containing protein